MTKLYALMVFRDWELLLKVKPNDVGNGRSLVRTLRLHSFVKPLGNVNCEPFHRLRFGGRLIPLMPGGRPQAFLASCILGLLHSTAYKLVGLGHRCRSGGAVGSCESALRISH